MGSESDSESDWVLIDESDGQLDIRRESRDITSRLPTENIRIGSSGQLSRKRSKTNDGSVSTLSSGHSSICNININKDYSTDDTDMIEFDRNIHVDVSMGDTLSRVWVVFENQRWYYGLGWSTTLATDRLSFSNHSGNVGIKKRPSFMGVAGDADIVCHSNSTYGSMYSTSNSSKSSAHSGTSSVHKQGVPLKWWVDLSRRDEELCDGSGWTYAFNFSDLKRTESMGSSDPEGCLVRRRRWLCVVPPSTTSVPHPVVSTLSVIVPPENVAGSATSQGTPRTNGTRPLAIPYKPRDMVVEYKVLVDLNMVYSKVEHMKSDGYCGMAQNLDSAKLLAAKYMSMYRTFPTDHVFSRNESLPADHVFGNGATDTKSGAYMARYADTYYITWHRPKLGGCWAGRVYAWPISRVREAGREDPLSWIPEKHVTSMIVFNAQREFDAQLGLDITPGRLSYDMEMDPLVPVDYLPSRREN